MLPVELGLDVGSHVDVVNNETLEGAPEVDVAPVAVHDLQAADLAIANLKAGKIAQVDAGTTELVTLGVRSRHRDSLPNPSRQRQWVAQRAGSCIPPWSDLRRARRRHAP